MTDYLKCDSPGCAHMEIVGSITAEMVNMSCPKCGANLLTQKDYDDFIGVTLPLVSAAKALGLLTELADHEGGQVFKIGNHEGTFTVTPAPTLQETPNE